LLDFGRKWKVPLLCVLLIAVVIWLFGPAINNDFTGFDDPDYVTANTHVQKGLSWENVSWAFTSTEAANWHPVTWLSHMTDCQLFGLQPWGHHLTSILIHAFNTTLLFLLLRQMTGSTWRSLIVAILFGLHPLRVESVAWIAERKDVLGAVFWMLTLWTYALFVERIKLQKPTSVFYVLSLCFFVLGLMSKPMLVTLPCVLLLLDYWPLGRLPRGELQSSTLKRLVMQKVPFFFAAGIVSVITFAVQKRAGAMTAAVPLTGRFENALVSYCRYLGKLFWPTDLSVFYPSAGAWTAIGVVSAGLLLAAISMVVIAARGSRPYLLVGWLWFVGTLVPVIGLVQVGEQSMADRYSYIPSIGILWLLVWAAHDLTKTFRVQAAGAAAAVAAAMAMSIMTREEISHWKSSETLFRHALEVTRNNYMAHHNLGAALDKQGRLDEAHIQYLEALRLNPNYAETHKNLGILLAKQGRVDEAMAQYREALRLDPKNADAHYNLGVALASRGRVDEAIAEFQGAIKARPDSADAHNNLGVLLQQKGESGEAIGHYLAAIKLNPDYARAHFNLGVALAGQGQLDAALSEFQAALRIKPDYTEAQKNEASVLEMMKQGVRKQSVPQK